MKKISTRLTACLSILLLISPAWVLAQQVPQNRKWVPQNPKYVEFNSAGIHFVPRDAKEGSDSVTTTLHLPAGQPWKIAFDVQMVPTASGGMSVHLTQGKTELCWLGAGDYYKYISGFLGTGNASMPFNQPWDNNWHSFAYESDGKMLSLWHNGNKCGETALAGTPDTLIVQSIGMELRVRNVHVENLLVTHTPNVDVPFYSEYFISPKFIDQWNGSNNGGSVTIGQKGLKLEGNGKGYPVLTSRSNPFPPNGDWTASFGYHYSSVGNYGTEIRCDRANGDAVLLVHQDVHGQFLTLNGKTRWRSSPGTEWHIISLVEKDNLFAAYLDGSQVGKDIAGNRPVSFHMGGGMLDNPWDWNNLEIAFVKVEIGVHPLDRSALNERTSPLQSSAHSTVITPAIITAEKPVLDGTIKDTSTDSLATTYEKITSDISSSMIPIIFPNGNALALDSYSYVNVNTAPKNPVLEYREQSTLDTTFDQVDLSQIDITNISLRIMPEDLTDKHYVAQYYIIFIPSMKNAECFIETNSLIGTSKVSMTSIYFRNQELAHTFIQHLCHAVNLITQNKSSTISK